MSGQNDQGDFDKEVVNRLARLRTMPVDTSRLDALVRSQLPASDERNQQRAWTLWTRPIRAVAASVVLLLSITAAVLLTSSGKVLALPTQMAQMHDDIVAGRTPVMKVDSIAAANRALAEQSPQSPSLPNVPPEHVMACCMKSVQNKKVACVLLQDQGVPVTMTVAKASDMKLPTAPTIERHGVSYRVQTEGKLHMVMTERNDRWVCLIGEVEPEQLMDLADKLQF